MMNVEYSSSSGPSYTDLLPQASGGKKIKYGNRYQIGREKKKTKNTQSRVYTVP